MYNTYTCIDTYMHHAYKMQAMWEDYVEVAYSCCAPDFWLLFESICSETATTQDDVFRVVRTLMNKPRNWPQSTRALRQRVQKRAGLFWDNVMYSHDIDLQSFNLPGLRSVKFTFVDPIFVWLQCCNALHESGIALQWDPQTLPHPETKEPMFGAGIEYGLLLRHATGGIPVQGKVALLSLSWDGGNIGYGSRSAVPLCVQVMNVNSSSTAGVGLIGYIPHVEVSDAYEDTSALSSARRHIQQVCTYMLSYTHICTSVLHIYVHIHTYM